jgi:hypothetical protein
VWLPKDAPWLGEYLDQWTAFPAAAHDDMVDSSSQALSHMLYSSGGWDAEEREDWQKREEENIQTERERFLNGAMYDVYGNAEEEAVYGF